MKTAFPSTQQTCTLTLFSNIPFDNTYQHHSLISNRFKYNTANIYTGTVANGQARERFLNRKKNATTYYYPRYDMTGEYNFHFSNGLIGSVTLPLEPAQTNANYLRVTCGNDIYYYFITGIQQQNFETYTLSLELDVLMTYQDEFLDGMKDIPVFTERKHCHRYTNDGLVPHCADLRTGEEIFSGVKPSIIESVTNTKFDNDDTDKLRGIVWAYICMDSMQQAISDVEVDVGYFYKNVPHPLAIACIPLNVDFMTVWATLEGTTYKFGDVDRYSIKEIISKAVSNGNIHSIKLSPYPPFYASDVESVAKSLNPLNGLYRYVITVKNTSVIKSTTHWLWEDEKATIMTLPDSNEWSNVFFIINEKKSNLDLDELTLDGVVNYYAPTINSNRYVDPKLLFKPFKSYKLASAYGSSEIFPELLYSEGVFANSKILLQTFASSYIGDNTFYTGFRYTEDFNDYVIINNHNLDNIGLSSNTNYVIPAGTNALDVFNSTQAESFYQSKTASGISAGLSIGGGVGSIALGIAGAIGTLGMSTPMSVGLIAGGVGAIGSGIAGMTNTIKSTNAKIEDLKNTPDSFNVAGSCFTSDFGRTDNLYPYVMIFRCSNDVIERANDYFFNFGYQVGRECYFNTELKFDNDVTGVLDNNLFGRTIFNYIKLSEDITNKINADIPLIIKQKLSSVFNNGITLWTFINNSSLWSGDDSVTLANNPDKWFMKHTLDNTEYSGS